MRSHPLKTYTHEIPGAARAGPSHMLLITAG